MSADPDSDSDSDSVSAAVSDPVDAAWRDVESSWSDEAAHKRFLVLAAGLDRLAEVGRRYREVRERDPARAEQATAQINRLLVMAMQNLSATRTEVRPRRARTVLLLMALGVSGTIVITAVSLWLRLS